MAFSSYEQFFSIAFVDKYGRGQQPFKYQRRLAEDEPLPSLINVRTGAGKNAGVGVAFSIALSGWRFSANRDNGSFYGRRNGDLPEPIFRIPVVFSVFIDHAQITMRLGLLVTDGAIDFE